MSIQTWPTTLPDSLLRKSYAESCPDNTLATNMDVGPAKKRRRATSAVVPVSGSIFVTLEQLAVFKEFYNTTLLSGSLRFSWIHPMDQTALEFRFAGEPPGWQDKGDGFIVRLNLEIMP